MTLSKNEKAKKKNLKWVILKVKKRKNRVQDTFIGYFA